MSALALLPVDNLLSVYVLLSVDELLLVSKLLSVYECLSVYNLLFVEKLNYYNINPRLFPFLFIKFIFPKIFSNYISFNYIFAIFSKSFFVSWPHQVEILVPVLSPNLTNVEPDQYVDGWPFENKQVLYACICIWCKI